MKLYFTTYIDDAAESEDDSFKVKWYGTQADQKRHAKQLKAEGMRGIEPDVTNVPTDKPALLDFLNANGVRP